MARRPFKLPTVRRRRRRRLSPWRTWLGLVVVVLGAAAVIEPPVRSALNCDIKGNVSPDTGERIYHVRGQAYYEATRVNPLRGERWFCSEADAVAAGWRRSLR